MCPRSRCDYVWEERTHKKKGGGCVCIRGRRTTDVWEGRTHKIKGVGGVYVSVVGEELTIVVGYCIHFQRGGCVHVGGWRRTGYSGWVLYPSPPLTLERRERFFGVTEPEPEKKIYPDPEPKIFWIRNTVFPYGFYLFFVIIDRNPVPILLQYYLILSEFLFVV